MTRPSIPVVLIALAATAFVACREPSTAAVPTKTTVLPDSADQLMFGLRVALTTAGVRRGELQADTAFFYDQTTRIEMNAVNTLFFDAAGTKNATMTAKRGTYLTRTERFEGWGDVVVQSTDGRRLTSPHVVYERTLNQISSDTSFTFIAPGREISGVGFRADPQLRNVQVLKGARGNSVVPAGGARRRGGP